MEANSATTATIQAGDGRRKRALSEDPRFALVPNT
jgi:hypothetical protein